jgi:hypothetical protein
MVALLVNAEACGASIFGKMKPGNCGNLRLSECEVIG